MSAPFTLKLPPTPLCELPDNICISPLASRVLEPVCEIKFPPFTSSFSALLVSIVMKPEANPLLAPLFRVKLPPVDSNDEPALLIIEPETIWPLASDVILPIDSETVPVD